MTRIEAVLFDFGGVVIDAPFAAFELLERRSRLPVGAIRDINSRNPDTNAWAQLERGAIDAETFVDRFEGEARALGFTLDARAVLAALSGSACTIDVARRPVLTAIAELRSRGTRIGLLTNNIAPLGSRTGASWVHEVFDTVIESCLVGLRKPDPQIYLMACRAVGSVPERTAFLDDLGINLKPARNLGMHTIKVTDSATAMSELLEAVPLGDGTPEGPAT